MDWTDWAWIFAAGYVTGMFVTWFWLSMVREDDA
jgi:hypothetical protein